MNKTMTTCQICSKIFQDFSIEHTETQCPVRMSRYCSHCAQYGHLTSTCPAKPQRWATHPVYMEQLIAPTDLRKYNINTKTLINTLIDPRKRDNSGILEVKDSDGAIADFLQNKSIKLSKKAKENKLKLHEYAQLNSKRIVLVQ